MFCCTVNKQIALRLIEPQHSEELFKLIDLNRDHLRRWHPWVDLMHSVAEVQRAVTAWQQQYANNRGFYAGIWFNGRFCGMINHLNVDWPNRWTALSYWLDAAHQGKGIMTASCRVMVAHGFKIWKLNRITIECATENTRSRAIAERLGFSFEGIVRGIEWLHDHYVDHAIYGLLRSDYEGSHSQLTTRSPEPEPSAGARAQAPDLAFSQSSREPAEPVSANGSCG